MKLRTAAMWVAVLVLGAAAQVAQAGAISIGYVLTGSPTAMALAPLATKNFGSAPVGGFVDGALETVTVHVTNEVGGPAEITGIQTTGDFAVTGGTCVGAQNLEDNDTCTLQLRFAPTASGQRNGLLSMSCGEMQVAAAAVGVLGLVCDDATHGAYNLNGIGLLASAIPALGREGITLLALLLIAASVLALRRRG